MPLPICTIARNRNGSGCFSCSTIVFRLGYDVPKIYFHEHNPPKIIKGRTYRYSIVDGKQRMKSIWQFIEGDFALKADFEYLSDPLIKAEGLTYSELGEQYPKLKIQFDSYPLSVVVIRTDLIERIEDMFSRLNEASPLNAPEKRNAYGGKIPSAIRKLAKHRFFTRTLPFKNVRYRHFDLAVKFLYIESQDKIVDTKKVYLDEFVRDNRTISTNALDKLLTESTKVLDAMTSTFTKGDGLLQSVGSVVLDYYLFRQALEDGWDGKLTRRMFDKFEDLRVKNRKTAEKDITKADYDLLEFDKYVQSPNDSYAMEIRLRVLRKYLKKRHGID